MQEEQALWSVVLELGKFIKQKNEFANFGQVIPKACFQMNNVGQAKIWL